MKVIGIIELEENLIENWIYQIDAEQLRVDDIFYALLVFEMYPKVKMELGVELDKLNKSMLPIKIGPSNSFNLYLLLKSFRYENIKSNRLYNNYKSYFEENEYDVNAIECLWKKNWK